MTEHSHKPVIGLTGGIGAGKSTVAHLLGELGCLVVHSDDLAREALLDPEIKATIQKWWGEDVIGEDGDINRHAVAGIVFADDADRHRLEGLTHPWIEARRRAIFAAAGPKVKAFVMDAPLLVEAGLARGCDAVVFIDAHAEVRRQRTRRAHGWDAREMASREAAQFSLDRKRQSADHSVSNNGDLDSLREQVQAVFKRIILRHQMSRSQDRR